MIEININKKFKRQKFSYKLNTDKNKIVLFGPSGAGKSNLLKMISGFYSPDNGLIRIDDKVFYDTKNGLDLPIFKRNVGYIPQEYTLFEHMTIRDNVEYGMKQRNIKIEDTVYNEVLEILEISDKLYEKPSSLSGGQKQRAAIARAMFSNPDILLFDEPFSALDSPIKEKLIDTLINLIDNIKIIGFRDNLKSLFVTHSIEDAYVLGEEIAIVHDGQIIEYGDKEKIFNRPLYLQTAALLNFKNIFEIDEYFMSNIPLLKDFGKSDSFGIRPENVMILRDNANLSGRENLLKGEARRIKIFGSYTEINVNISNGKTIYVKLPSHAFEKLNITLNKKLTVSLKTESIIKLRRY